MIEFQYFKECPNAAGTLDNLLALVEESFISMEEIELVEVPSPELASKRNFQGSPTILVDGKDLYTGVVPTGFSFNCRIFRINDELTGVLSKEFIRTRIVKLRNTSS